MTVQLLDLPQLCLEEILKKLTFSQISQLGGVCRRLRETAKTIFRVYFRHQEDIIEREMEKIEVEASKYEKLTIDEHLYLALLHSVLRIVLSEAKMLKAHCWRYMKDSSYDFCFPAGRILDEFEKILQSVKGKTLSKDMEPKISTTLFHLGEKFYDYFDTKIETSFRELSSNHTEIIPGGSGKNNLSSISNLVSPTITENLLRDIHKHMKRNRLRDAEESEKTMFGVKLMDILDCCATCDSHSLLCYDNEIEGFQIRAEYKLTDVNVLQALPSIGPSVTTVQKQLNKICRYIRNNVRWTNLFHPLQDLWMLEDAIELNKNIYTASALLRQWKLQRMSSRIAVDNADDNNISHINYRKIVSRFKNCFGLVVSAKLECPTRDDMPLKLQKYLDSKDIKPPDCMFNTNMNKTDDGLSNILSHNLDERKILYKFHLELKIQYPSFLTEKIQEAILKVDQLGDETIITSNEDEIRKSATFRADEGNYDD